MPGKRYFSCLATIPNDVVAPPFVRYVLIRELLSCVDRKYSKLGLIPVVTILGKKRSEKAPGKAEHKATGLNTKQAIIL